MNERNTLLIPKLHSAIICYWYTIHLVGGEGDEGDEGDEGGGLMRVMKVMRLVWVMREWCGGCFCMVA